MRKILLTLALLLGVVAATCAATRDSGEVTFEKKRIDFGTVSSTGGMVKMDYVFTNGTSSPVSIVTVTNGGCNCTKPQFPLEPIAPGKTGKIKVSFNPATFKGEFHRSVKVQFSYSRKRTVLKFNGVVVP